MTFPVGPVPRPELPVSRGVVRWGVTGNLWASPVVAQRCSTRGGFPLCWGTSLPRRAEGPGVRAVWCRGGEPCRWLPAPSLTHFAEPARSLTNRGLFVAQVRRQALRKEESLQGL